MGIIHKIDSDGKLNFYFWKNNRETDMKTEIDEKNSFTSLAFSSNNQYFLCIYSDNLCLFDLKEGEVKVLPNIYKACFANHSHNILTCSTGPKVCLWDCKGNLLSSLDIEENIRDVSFSPDGRKAITLSSEVYLWDFTQPLRENEAVEQREYVVEQDVNTSWHCNIL